MDVKLLSLRLETIEAFLSSAFDGFHADIVDVVANKLDGDSKKLEMLAELEAIRAKFKAKRGTK